MDYFANYDYELKIVVYQSNLSQIVHGLKGAFHGGYPRMRDFTIDEFVLIIFIM